MMTGFACKECSVSKTCNLHDPLGDEETLLLNILRSLSSWKREPPPPPLWTLPTSSSTSDPTSPSFLHYCLLKDNSLALCTHPCNCKCASLLPHPSSSSSDFSLKVNNMGSKDISASSSRSRRPVTHLAKHLKNNCDKIFDSSIPFVIELPLLRKVIDAINSLTSEDSCSEDSLETRDLLMFLKDFLAQTPSLCVTSPGTSTSTISPKKGQADSSSVSSSSTVTVPSSPSVPLGLFKSLVFLELRNTPVSKLSGLQAIRSKLKRAKCSRCISSVSQLFGSDCSTSSSSSSVPSVWPELKDIDLSLNFISGSLSPQDIDLFNLLPSAELLNLSRNRITSIDSSFSRSLPALCILNLSYNQLTHVPPIPPTVEQLYLSHNYIAVLTSPPNSSSSGAGTQSKFTLSSSVLKNLKVLDLSTNLLSRTEDLLALKELGALEKLSLLGNPLSFLDNYRNTISGYLHRWVISRKFLLDKKPLSSSEVRWGIERSKEGNFVPYVPANSLLISQAMSSSGYGGGAPVPSGSSSGSKLSHLKSLTQSYDSSTSSVRSSKRKKAKIREIVEEIPQVGDDLNCTTSSSSRRPVSRASSSIRVGLQRSEVNTRQAVAALREKYGAEHWLLTQAGGELEKLLHIPTRQQVPLTDVFSRSLPPVKTSQSAVTLSSTPTGQGGQFPGQSSSETLQPPSTEESNSEEFYSCFSTSSLQVTSPSSNLMETSGGQPSIFDNQTHVDEIFDISSIPEGEEVSSFSVFQAGEVFKLIIHDGYLIHTDSDFVILAKWDLNSLASLEEERCDSETESVEFRLKFDTLRKQNRERSFIMGKKEFGVFDGKVSPFIEVKVLEEFAEALQCTKCTAQFAKAMAKSKVAKVNGVPKEVSVCPTCDCDVLVTLDSIPLPNNACIELDEVDVRHGPLRTSTPLPVRTQAFGGRASSLSRSIPKQTENKSSGSPIIDFFRHLPSSLRSRPPPPLSNQMTQEDAEDEGQEDDGGSILCLDISHTPSAGSDSAQNTNSDTEVISNDSSSIEVLAKNYNSESTASSDAEAEEALEVPTLESNLSNVTNRTVIMSESTSSSSCADSIVTTYERGTQVAHLSHPSQSSSLASNSTLTSKPSPSISRRHIHPSTIPIRYDYVNFGRTDHRLQLWSEISVFKSQDERLLALAKCVVIVDASSSGSFLGVVIFSSKKVYVFRITGPEGDKPQDWLSKVNAFDLTKFTKLDVLIGRHGVGVDFSGKYLSFVFRDSERTSAFLEYFMSDICGELTCPPVVRDFSQTQKTMLSPTNPITYFGILRLAQCESPENVYAISAILVTNEEALLITDLSWMAGCGDTVSTRHGRRLSYLRQVETMESDPSYLSLVFGIESEQQIVRWELCFETPNERKAFESCVRSEVKVACVHEIPFICLSQPLEP